MKQISLVAIFFSLLTYSVFAQTDLLRQKITQIISEKKATVGLLVSGFEKSDTLSINGDRHFPLQSVFKFHIGLAVLDRIEKKKLALDQKIFIKKSDLSPDLYSPIREKYPEGNIEMTLAEILRYTVAESDNSGCDILLKLIGGAKEVNNYIHSLGISDVNIQNSEAEIQKEWSIQFNNYTSPKAANQLLLSVYRNRNKLFSKENYDFIWKVMTETSTGKNRLKGLLPAGTVVAHKTGTSGTKDGVMAAVNDIGIITLPNGKYYAISVFVSNSHESIETNEKIIADVSKVVWNYFTEKK
jgi:beta-lactamase class A